MVHELLKNPKLWNFGNLLVYTLPFIIQKEDNNSNPLHLPRERLWDKGRRSTIIMVFSIVSSM
jgi:hypothetical protein